MHEDAIQDLQISPDGSHGVTASLDKTAKLVDIETFEVLKTYKTGRLVQSAAMSPIFDHVCSCLFFLIVVNLYLKMMFWIGS